MSLRAILYAYVLGGLTFIPLVLLAACFYAIYTSVPVADADVHKTNREKLEHRSFVDDQLADEDAASASADASSSSDVNDLPKPRKGWLTVRRTFEESSSDGSYVALVRGFLDARSKDPKRSRPKDMWYVALKGKVLYLYEDESMTECEAAIELSGHDVVIFPEGLLDGELFARRNAICLKPKVSSPGKNSSSLPSVTREMVSTPDYTEEMVQKDGSAKQQQKDKEKAQELERKHEEARQEALDPTTPWFIFVRSNVEMEDWYLSLIHASDNPPNSPTLAPLYPIFHPEDVQRLVDTLDEQPDVIPMRWLNALIGRIFFSYYRTQKLESYIIGRLMKKLSKVKRPAFLTELSVREVSVGNKAPTLSKPMLKELTKEGDASLEVHLLYKGEVRITVDATATINLGARFKSYTVKLVLAAVLREIEGNLLVKVKRPPSNRIWYAFTQMPRMVLDVEPVVSDRQITWSMILSTIESRLKEVIQESVVLPNMDDIAFFESSRYSHRGGIWADASRHERSSDLFPSSTEATDETRTTDSATASDSPAPRSPELNPVEMERSHSAPVETRIEVEGSDILDVNLASRTQTVPGLTQPSSNSIKRRTWFGGNRDTDADSNSSQRTADDASENGERGRLARPSEMVSRRSSSTPSAASDVDETRVVRDGEQPPTQSTLSSQPRPSSRQSRSSSPSQDAAVPEPSSGGPTESLFAGFRSKSPNQSSKSLATSPTANFFQTLKSRDKQAISNTAKEAMRKWGWGGLKKDAPANNEDIADGDSQKQPETQSHKPRPSYAEVRAAVAQRRGANTDGLLGPAFMPSEAVTIPQDPTGKQRAASVSSSRGQGSVSGRSMGDTSSPSTSPQPDTLTADAQAQRRSISPSSSPQPPRQRTISHQSQFSGEGQTSLSDEDEHPTQPIYTQPPAPKAMTIPGIHASHRGEVMSMGYAPPPPPPASNQKIAPAIQSVYRLWKTPSGQTITSEEGPQTQDGFTGRDQDATPTSGPAASQSEASISVRAVPPPLPPRSSSTHAIQLLSEPPMHPPEPDKSSPPATAALQSIVSKDNSKRASLAEPFASPSSSPGRQTRSNVDDTTVRGEQALAGNLGVDENMTEEVTSKPKPPALPPRRTQIVA